MTRKILKPDPVILRRQCEVDHILIEDLTRLYGYGNVSNLYMYCRKWGIQPYRHPRPNTHLLDLNLSPEQHQIVLGTMLGDGYIRHDRREGGRSDVLVIAHGHRQREYLEWKKCLLEPFFQADRPREYVQKGFSTGSLLYTYMSSAHPIFTEYRRLFYPDGVKRITQPILQRLQSLALAFWLMDDGSFHRTRGYIYLSTNGYTHAELKLAAGWFGELLGIAPHIHSAGRANQYHLAFNRRAADVLRDLVRSHFFEPLLYKLGL